MNVSTVGHHVAKTHIAPGLPAVTVCPRNHRTRRLLALLALAALALTAFPRTSSATDVAATCPAPAQITATQPASQPATKPKPKTLDEEGTLDFLKQHEPEVYKDALVIREKDNKKFQDLLAKEFMPAVHGLLDLQRHNPEMFAVTMEDRRLAYHASQLARELRENSPMTPEERAAKKDELASVVTQQFATRQKMRQLELDAQQKRLVDLQKNLDGLKQGLDDREKNKAELINARIADLLKKNPKVEW